MREIDRLTTERYAIPSLLLMEAAGGAAARSIYEHFKRDLKHKAILILCGHGNNGGDGAALGRALWSMGATVTIILFGQVRETRGDALANFGIVGSINESEVDENGAILRFEECISSDQSEFLMASIVDYDVIVDALLGTGLTRPLEGLFLEVVDRLMSVCDALERTRARRPLLVSLDLPSGLNADEAETDNVCVSADMTITFTAPKIANVLPPASRKNGRLIVADIGSPAPLLKQTASSLFLAEESDARGWLEATRYQPGSYKKSHGSVLIIAGSSNYAGAAVLCGNAAMRAGAGLVRVASPASAIESIKARLMPEVIACALPETMAESNSVVAVLNQAVVSEEAVSLSLELAESSDVIVIGPGLSSNEESTVRFILSMIEQLRADSPQQPLVKPEPKVTSALAISSQKEKEIKPIVIDADGLNALAPWPDDIQGSEQNPIILTPHQGEMLRLLGATESDRKRILKNRVTTTREFAMKHHLFLVLKGEHAIIADPNGRVVINPTGNQGLGTAGAGDTLTGFIASFIAQTITQPSQGKSSNYDWLLEALVAALYIGGLAGEITARAKGMRTMVASDIIQNLSTAITTLDPAGEFA